jgi:hypothetical protein
MSEEQSKIRLVGKRREKYAEALRKTLEDLRVVKAHAEMIGRDEDVGDVEAALLALERMKKALLEPKPRRRRRS